MFYQNKGLVVKKKKEAKQYEPKYIPQKKLLYQLPNTRSDGKGFCLPKRLYFHPMIFTLKTEESEKAKKKKAEMRLI